VGLGVVNLSSMSKTFVVSIGGSLVATPSPNIEYIQKVAKMLIRLSLIIYLE
jgi:DNA-binding transcriptional MocR family regulator